MSVPVGILGEKGGRDRPVRTSQCDRLDSRVRTGNGAGLPARGPSHPPGGSPPLPRGDCCALIREESDREDAAQGLGQAEVPVGRTRPGGPEALGGGAGLEQWEQFRTTAVIQGILLTVRRGKSRARASLDREPALAMALQLMLAYDRTEGS